MKKILLSIFSLAYSLVAVSQAASFDSTFATNGIGKYAITKAGSVVGENDMALQPDGKIVVATFFDAADANFCVLRFNSDGSLDNSFSGDGIVIIPLEPGSYDYSNSLAIQPDGKIVVAGIISYLSTKKVAIVRLNSDGTLDTSFDGDGKIYIQAGDSNDESRDVLVDINGKIVVAGTTMSGGFFRMFCLRLNNNGTLDTGFDSDGKVIISIGANDYANSVAMYSTDNRIVLGGYSDNGTKWDFACVRLLSDGTLDNNFDSDGKLVIPVTGQFNAAKIVAIQPIDGKILLAGYGYNGQYTDFAVVRLNPEDGSLDANFDGDGIKLFPVGPTFDEVKSVISQISDGSIILGGRGVHQEIIGNQLVSHSYFTFAKLLRDGTLDNSFDTDGKVLYPILGYNDVLSSIAQRSDGKIVATGFTSSGNASAVGVMQLNTDGSLDINFDNDGKLSQPIGNDIDLANSIAIQPSDNKLILAGRSYMPYSNGTGSDFSAIRLNTDGSLDNSFDGDGKINISNAGFDEALAVAVSPADGKAVIVGYGYNGTKNDFFIVRLNTDGSLDNTFDGDGKKLLPISIGQDKALGVAIQSDGKIVIVGVSSIPDFTVVRLNTDGSLDNSFDGDGIAQVNAGSITSGDVASALIIQPDGKIVVVGGTNNGVNSSLIAVVRLNSNGSLDNTFDGDGKVQFAFPLATSSIATSLALQPSDNKIVIGGHAFMQGSYRFGIARLNTNGSIDATFSGGVITLDIGYESRVTGIAVQGNGRIVASGYSIPTMGAINGEDVTFARVNADGTADGTFNGGFYYYKIINEVWSQSANGMLIQPDGKIVLAGYSPSDDSPIDFLAIRLKGDPPPVNITCPPNKTASTGVGACSAVITGLEPTFTPNIPETPYSYTLSGATTGSGNGSASGLAFNSGTTTVTYTLTNEPAKTCSFTVNVTAVTSITPSGSVNLCKGSVLVLSAEVGAGLSYQWYRNNKVLAGATNATLNVTTAGSYKAFVSGPGCSATSNTTTVTLISTPKAVISRIRGNTDICATGSVELIAASVNGATYQWNKDGAPITGANGNSYVATEAGSYTVTVSKSGCAATSAPVVVTNSCPLRTNKSIVINKATVINEATTEAEVKIYPNPSRGTFNIYYRSRYTDEKTIMLRVLNMKGQLIWQQTAAVAGGYMYKQITLPGKHPPGAYLVQINTSRKLYSVKLVIQ